MPSFDPAAPRLLTDQVRYPESPRWREGKLWFSDVHAFAVKTVDDDGDLDVVVEIPGRPAGLGFLPDGRLLIAGALDRKLWLWDGAVLTMAADLSSVTLGLLNDMVVGADGRAYVGDTGFNLMNGEEPRPGQIFAVDLPPDGQPAVVRVVADDVMFPNGAALSADGRRYVLCETAAQRVSTFAVSDDGSLRRTGILAELPDLCDGLCADSAGGVWVALLRIGEFRHLTADGLCDEIVSADGRLAVACVLGGPERSTLYLCSAATTMSDLAQGRSRGLIHARPVTISGAGLP